MKQTVDFSLFKDLHPCNTGVFNDQRELFVLLFIVIIGEIKKGGGYSSAFLKFFEYS